MTVLLTFHLFFFLCTNFAMDGDGDKAARLQGSIFFVTLSMKEDHHRRRSRTCDSGGLDLHQ